MAAAAVTVQRFVRGWLGRRRVRRMAARVYMRVRDRRTGLLFYHNQHTGCTLWNKPRVLGTLKAPIAGSRMPTPALALDDTESAAATLSPLSSPSTATRITHEVPSPQHATAAEAALPLRAAAVQSPAAERRGPESAHSTPRPFSARSVGSARDSAEGSPRSLRDSMGAAAQRAVEWEQHRTEDGRIFFSNRVTGESAWELPGSIVRAVAQLRRARRQVVSRAGSTLSSASEWEACQADDGQRYFYNVRTGASSWTPPTSLALKLGLAAVATATATAVAAPQWVHYETDEGVPYYFHTPTGESVWELPEGAVAAPGDAAEQ